MGQRGKSDWRRDSTPREPWARGTEPKKTDRPLYLTDEGYRHLTPDKLERNYILLPVANGDSQLGTVTPTYVHKDRLDLYRPTENRTRDGIGLMYDPLPGDRKKLEERERKKRAKPRWQRPAPRKPLGF